MLLRIASVALLASTASAQSTWYVDVNGTPPGTGTQVDPYMSIQLAIAQAATLSDSVVRSNVFTSCISSFTEGIGIYADCSSSPFVERCQILENNQAARGGGTYGAGTYSECLIRDNTCQSSRPFNSRGAGTYGADLSDCEVYGNTAT